MLSKDSREAFGATLFVITIIGGFVWLLFGVGLVATSPAPDSWFGIILYLAQIVVPILALLYAVCISKYVDID